MMPNRKTFDRMLGLAVMFATVVHAQTVPSTRPGPPALPSAAAHYSLNPDLPTLWIIGASAVRNGHDNGADGQWGWGNPIAAFFDRSRLNVVNFALGGTSTRTYRSLGLWDHVLADMKRGDYLLIQFGSNDSSPVNDTARARGTLPGNGDETQEIDNLLTKKHEVVHTHGWYLRQFIAEARAKGAGGEIVLSPDPKNSWLDGNAVRAANFQAWAQAAARQAADTIKAVLSSVEDSFEIDGQRVHLSASAGLATTSLDTVDANELIAKRYDAAGREAVTQSYFPDGETEHTDWAGAILNARCIVEGIRNLDRCPLADFLLPTPPADPPLPSGKAR